MKYPKQFVKNIYSSSSEEIANATTSDENLDLIEKISQKYKLDVDKSAFLEEIVTDVILGLAEKNELKTEFSSRLGINSGDLANLESDVLTQIISNIPEKVLLAQREYVKAKFEEFSKSSEATIKSIPEEAKKEEVVATGVIVERHEELTSGVEKPKTNLTFEDRKKLVPNIPNNQPHYADKIDPYREPI